MEPLNTYAYAYEWQVVDEQKLRKIAKQLLKLGILPEFNPMQDLEYITDDPTDPYRSEYTAFEVNAYAAQIRRSAIDLLSELPGEKQELARDLIQAADEVIAEGAMAGAFDPLSAYTVGVYDFVICYIERLRTIR